MQSVTKRIDVCLQDGKVLACLDMRNNIVQELMIALDDASACGDMATVEILLPVYRFVAGV
jgi:hypothetical protein